MLSTVRKLKRKCTIHYKKQKRRPDQAGTPAAPTPPQWNPPPVSRERKSRRPRGGDRQLCQSRRPSPESRKVVRAKVVSHSRKSRESLSVLRVIVAGRTHHIFEILLLQVLSGNLISELLVGCQHDLLLVRIAHVVLHQEDTGDRIDLSVLHIVFHLSVQKLIRLFNQVTAFGG